MKTLIAFLILALVPALSLANPTDSLTTPPVVFIQEKQARVLKNPDPFYSGTLAVLRMGQRVELLDSTGTFYQIRLPESDLTGYVSKTSVSGKIPDLSSAGWSLEQEPAVSVKIKNADLILAVVALGLAWDYGTTTSDMNKTLQKIEDKKLNIEVDHLKTSRTTKFTLAVLFGLVGAYELWNSVTIE